MPSMAKLRNPGYKRAVDRARSALICAPEFMASLEPRWRSVMPGVSPAEALNCSDDVWSWIALCRRPRSAFFHQDLQSIASAAGVEVDKLRKFVMTALTAEQFKNAPPEPIGDYKDLLAARKYDSEEE